MYVGCAECVMGNHGFDDTRVGSYLINQSGFPTKEFAMQLTCFIPKFWF